MKVTLKELEAAPKLIQLNGKEVWLQELYESFLQPQAKDAELLSGSITVKSDGYGYASVSGELQFTPYVPCSRCADPIKWNISKTLTARFKPRDELADAPDVDLIPDDLDFYYLEDDTINLQQVLIDSILESLPSQLIKKTPNGKSCLICNKDISSHEVYRSKPKEEESPFAALKNLKLPN